MAHPTMVERATDYLLARRRLGFGLKSEGEGLMSFAKFADEQGHRGSLTTSIALKWATLPINVDPRRHARRLAIVRRFAAYLALYDPETQIPPRDTLGSSRYPRSMPHIYSPEELKSLLKETEQLGPQGGLRPHTYRTLFGLLVATGLRISEALALTRDSVDFKAGVLRIEETKFRKARLVPIHPSTSKALCAYAQKRDGYLPYLTAETFFLTERGTSLKYRKTLMTFLDIRERLGWNESATRPRIHDIRHTFAVRMLLDWYREGVSIDNRVAVLATYLGHAQLSSTYWYLSAVPELMAKASERFEMHAGIVSRLGGDEA